MSQKKPNLFASKRHLLPLAALIALTAIQVEAGIVTQIDTDSQTMSVEVDGEEAHVWGISTGRRGYETPPGDFKPTWLSADHRSTQYDDAPMPWSVFFNEGIATHGTTELRNLGRPASHGCVRLDPANTKTFFELVQSRPLHETTITVTGSGIESEYVSDRASAYQQPIDIWSPAARTSVKHKRGGYFGEPTLCRAGISCQSDSHCIGKAGARLGAQRKPKLTPSVITRKNSVILGN